MKLIILLTDSIIKSVVDTDPNVPVCLISVPILNVPCTHYEILLLKWHYWFASKHISHNVNHKTLAQRKGKRKSHKTSNYTKNQWTMKCFTFLNAFVNGIYKKKKKERWIKKSYFFMINTDTSLYGPSGTSDDGFKTRSFSILKLQRSISLVCIRRE